MTHLSLDCATDKAVELFEDLARSDPEAARTLGLLQQEAVKVVQDFDPGCQLVATVFHFYPGKGKKTKGGQMDAHADSDVGYKWRMVVRFTRSGDASALRFMYVGYEKDVYDAWIPAGWGLLAGRDMLVRGVTNMKHAVPRAEEHMFTMIFDFADKK